MIDVIRKINWLISEQFGFDIRRLVRSFIGIPRYVLDWLRFRRTYSGRMTLLPCLHDWHESGGSAATEYFFQDVFVAQQIFQNKPVKHVDIGSRIDGFAAHVASFREIEVFDIRPVNSNVSGMVFRQADLMNAEGLIEGYCDSLSCLHALEHFGLGRYGDPIDSKGHLAGLRNMAKLLQPGGVFYLSVPVGQARVEFNAQRIINPCELLQAAAESGLVLKGVASKLPGLPLKQAVDLDAEIKALEHLRYALGIFTFAKR